MPGRLPASPTGVWDGVEMRSPALKCSAVLCVLDEIDLIERSIEALTALSVDQVIVIDGGSTDGTYEYLTAQPDIEVEQVRGKGLLAQRLHGIRKAKSETVLFIDVDDEISPPAFSQPLNQLATEKDLDGLQFQLRTPLRTYWEAGWDAYFAVISSPGARVVLLGRPSLTWRHKLPNLTEDPPQGIFAEDTWIFYQERHKNRVYRVSPSASVRKTPLTLKTNVQQFWRYGRADSSLSVSLRTSLDLYVHAGLRILFARSVAAVGIGKAKYVPLFIIHGLVRAVSHFYYDMKKMGRS